MKQNRITRLLSNTLIFTVGKFVSKLIVIFMLPFYTSYLSSAEYSTSDLITNLCNLLIPLACLGVSEGIFRNAADKNLDKEAFFTNGFMLMIFGSLGFLALSPLLKLTGYFNDYVWLIICYVLASNIHSVCSQYVCAIGRTKLFAVQGVINTVLTVTLNIIFLVGFNMGINGYVLSIVLADFLTTLLVFFIAKLYRAFKPSKINGRIMKDLLRFCLPLVPSTIFWWITGVSDRYMVAFMRSDAENGLYAAAYKIPTLLTYVVTIFNDAWKLSAVSESSDREKCAEFYSQIYKYYESLKAYKAYRVCPTLLANMGSYPDSIPIILDDYGIRKITPYECLALQGFPNGYRFPKIPMASAYKQCGNSVVVPVIRRIAENIKKVFN